MAKVAKILGVAEFKRDLRQAKNKHVAGLGRGLKKGGLFLQRKSQEIVPVDKGPLKASAFTRASGSGNRIQVIVGYTAYYAVYVHENLEALHGAEYNAAYILGDSKTKRSKTSGRYQSKFRWTQAAIEKGYHLTSKPKPRGPNQQAKFLERPARQYRQDILAIVIKETRIK